MKYYLVATEESTIPRWWPKPYPKRIEVVKVKGNCGFVHWNVVVESLSKKWFHRLMSAYAKRFPTYSRAMPPYISDVSVKLNKWKIERER